MSVVVPQDLRHVWMGTTRNDVFLQKQVKHQENKMLIITNFENKKMLELQRDNQKIMSRLNHEKDVEEIRQLKMIVECETTKLLKETAAYERQATKLIEARSIKTLAERTANEKAVKVLAEAKAYEDARKCKADMITQEIRDNADTRLVVAADSSQAWEREC